MESPGQQPASDGPARSSVDWADLLARHDRWLRTAVFARLREPEGVDEVMQAVAVAAVEQRAPLVDLSRVAPWLYRLAVWQTLLYRRRAGRQRKLVGRFESEVAARPEETISADPLTWLLSEERRDLVRLALERLSRRDAEILLLKYSEEWSYRELAERLGISESAVEARLHRARSRMRNLLSQLNLEGD